MNLDLGTNDNTLSGPQAAVYRPEKFEAVKPLLFSSEVSEKQAGGDLRGVKELSSVEGGQSSDSASTQNADIFGPIKDAINVKKFWDEVYQEAREKQNMEHEEAVRKANEAAILYVGYLGGATAATGGVTAVTKNPHAAGLTAFLGWVNADDAKKWIKGKVFTPYNPVWDGTTSD